MEDGREDWTRLILETAPDAFVAIDASGVITEWNPKAEETFGWTRADALGRVLAETIVPDEYRSAHKAGLAEFHRTGHGPILGKTIELVAMHKDGHRIPIELAVGVLDEPDGHTFYAFIRNITGRHQTEEVLRAREHQLSEALSLAHLGSWSWDIATNEVTWSDELFVMFGLEPGQHIDLETYLSRVHPDDRGALESKIATQIGEPTTFEFDHRIIRTDDSVRWLHWHGEVVSGPKGPERIYGTAEDVTDHKQAESARSLIAAIFESTDDAIKSMATDGTIISWNAAAEQLYGYPADEILGRPVTELFPPEEVDAVLVVFRRVVQGGQVERAELKQRQKDGTLVDVSATLSPIRVGGTIVGVSAVSRNITARKRAQEALESALKREQRTVRELQELDRMRNDFIADVSHELRTPLTNISGYTKLLSTGAFGEINDEQTAAVDVIIRNTKRLLDLIEDIMALSSMESGVFSLNIEPTDLTGLIVGAGEAIASAAEAKSIELTVDVQPDMGFGMVDPSQLDRALLNVLSNAVKFTAAGGRAVLRARRVAGDVFITVTDNGIGIDPVDQEQVFKRFFRSSLATRSAIQGTGLGLVITKAIVDHHHGSIRLESAPGRGTTVDIRIPANRHSAVAV